MCTPALTPACFLIVPLAQWDNVKFTYSKLTVPQGKNEFTQEFIDSDGNKVECTWTCESEEAPGSSTAWNIKSGEMTVGKDNAAVHSAFECAAKLPNGDAPNNPLLNGNGNCGGDAAFQIVMTEHKDFDVTKDTSWRWKIEYLLGDGVSRMAYVDCPEKAGQWDGTAFTMRGDAKYAPPSFPDVNVWTQPGTLIIMIIFVIFASGWVYLFYASCGKLPDLPDSDDEDEDSGSESGSDSGSEETESGSDESDSGEESGH